MTDTEQEPLQDDEEWQTWGELYTVDLEKQEVVYPVVEKPKYPYLKTFCNIL